MPNQLILLGPQASVRQQALETAFNARVLDLGLTPGSDTEVIGAPHKQIDWGGAPVVVWLGSPHAANDQNELALLKRLFDLPSPVFPIVEDLSQFQSSVPQELLQVNGIQWQSDHDDLPRLVADLLRAMRLLREQRQAFVSYRRDRTTGVARQIFSEMAHRGYLPFLDTASVPSATDFQETLWSRMADIDLVVLLDAPGTLDSNWVHQELNRAHALSLGVLQLVWPSPPQAPMIFRGSPGTELCDRLELSDADFDSTDLWDASGRANPARHLSPPALDRVIAAIEVARIRSLNRRRKKIVGEIMDLATSRGLGIKLYPPDATEYPIGALGLIRSDVEVGCVIPLVGLPDAIVLDDHESLLKRQDWRHVKIAFDGLGISPRWSSHVGWLNSREKLVARQIDELDEWMVKL